ncbi:MAG: hypothetical protein PSX36_07985 [bacterium]|nr:hypothetical protein [bacterium]
MSKWHLYFFLLPFILLNSSFYAPLPECGPIPDLNKKVVAFVKTQISKKVGRGECWDLASEALNTVGATWDHQFSFGKELKKSEECIFPGDIIQFEGVELNYRRGNRIFHEDLAHHTAIIYEVNSKGNYVLAQQNTDSHGRKVGLDPFEIQSVSKGIVKIFRPMN